MLEKKRTTFDYVNVIVMLILTIIMAFPIYYVIIVSIGDYREIVTSNVFLFPKTIDWSSYKAIFETSRITNAFWVTVFITVVGTALGMVVSVLMAYPLSKTRVPGIKAVFLFVMFTMFFSGGTIPYFLTIKNLGLVDKLAVLILPTCVSVFNVIVLKNYFATIPASLEESAKIDGANDITILFRIVLPTSKPILATISLYYAVDRWNEWWHAMLFINKASKQPLQIVLREVLFNFNNMKSSIGASLARSTQATLYSRSLQMATVVVATLPILIVYPFVQKYFASGVMVGAIKE